MLIVYLIPFVFYLLIHFRDQVLSERLRAHVCGVYRLPQRRSFLIVDEVTREVFVNFDVSRRHILAVYDDRLIQVTALLSQT